jgi:hypothetical protein
MSDAAPESLRPRGSGPHDSAGDPDGSQAAVLDEREAVAGEQPGDPAEGQPGTGAVDDVEDESGYTTEVEQGASQRP